MLFQNRIVDALFFFFAAPIVSILCVRFTCRPVALFGGVAIAVGVVSTAFAPNLAVTYVTFGFITGLIPNPTLEDKSIACQIRSTAFCSMRTVLRSCDGEFSFRKDAGTVE